MEEQEKKVLVQLRLSPDEARELREAGQSHGRKLPAEIMHRLRGSLTGAEPEIYGELYGFTAESRTRNRALGQAVGYLAARLERAFRLSGDERWDRAKAMAMVKEAVPVLLGLFGATDEHLTSDDRLVAHAFAHRFAQDLAKAVEAPTSVATLPEEVVLARIAKAFDELIRSNQESAGPISDE